MESNPLISIIIPTRNRGALLATCLNAIQAQSYPHYEVLLLDDGSDLENRELAKQILQHYDHRVQWHEVNAAGTPGSGVSVIRNKGIKLAKGDYITFCDDDDYWCRNDHLEVAVNAMAQQKAQAYFAGIRVEDTEGKVVFEKMMPNVEKTLKPDQSLSVGNVYRVSAKQMLSHPDYAHLNITVVDKDLLQKIGGFWEHTNYCEDVDLFVRICDVAETILFRPEICAVHNAPAQRPSISASNRLTLQDKYLLEASVYQHLLMTCNHPDALRYAKISLSYLYKKIAEKFKAEGNKAATISYAQRALAVRPTLKWSIYLVWLYLNALL